MKEKPIIFSTEMVRAILDGRKTQTRRVVKPQPKPHQSGGWIWEKVGGVIATKSGKIYKSKMLSRNPYGQSGDRLWVRETWRIFDNKNEDCGCNEPCSCHRYNGKPIYRANNPEDGYKWKPSIHMPKKYARIWLEITNIRVERLQEISEEDSIAEGSQIPCSELPKSCQQGTLTERTQFSRIWDSINGKKYPWADNPWVWVIEFLLESALHSKT